MKQQQLETEITALQHENNKLRLLLEKVYIRHKMGKSPIDTHLDRELKAVTTRQDPPALLKEAQQNKLKTTPAPDDSKPLIDYDALYKEWRGNSHTQDSCKPVLDSADAQDFARYCVGSLSTNPLGVNIFNPTR